MTAFAPTLWRLKTGREVLKLFFPAAILISFDDFLNLRLVKLLIALLKFARLPGKQGIGPRWLSTVQTKK